MRSSASQAVKAPSILLNRPTHLIPTTFRYQTTRLRHIRQRAGRMDAGRCERDHRQWPLHSPSRADGPGVVCSCEVDQSMGRSLLCATAQFSWRPAPMICSCMTTSLPAWSGTARANLGEHEEVLGSLYRCPVGRSSSRREWALATMLKPRRLRPAYELPHKTLCSPKRATCIGYSS